MTVLDVEKGNYLDTIGYAKFKPYCTQWENEIGQLSLSDFLQEYTNDERYLEVRLFFGGYSLLVSRSQEALSPYSSITSNHVHYTLLVFRPLQGNFVGNILCRPVYGAFHIKYMCHQLY